MNLLFHLPRGGFTAATSAALLLAALAHEPSLVPLAAAPAAADYVLIVTGGELLDGSIADAHTPYLTRTLRPLGLHCVRVTLVDDQAEALHAALRVATRDAPLVLVTGGLGPTVNDITREVLSDFTGIPLAEDPALVAELARRFNQPVDQLRDNLRRQCRVPQPGVYLPNTRGTAVGLVFEASPATIVALPGPPRELQPMVEQALVPWLRKRLGLREEGCAITLRFVGIGQSAIDATLREQVPLPPRMVVTSRFEGTRVDFTFSLPEAGPQSEQQLMTLTEEVRRHLGSHLYATNTVTLEEVVLARLKARGASWVVAESSGPHLAAALSRAAFRKEAGPPLVDSLAATSESDLRRLVSLDDVSWTALTGPDVRAAALARAARRLAGSAWALAIGEPVAVQGDRRVVWVALAGPGERAEIWSVGLRDSPETGWPNLVSEVLDHLRRLE